MDEQLTSSVADHELPAARRRPRAAPRPVVRHRPRLLVRRPRRGPGAHRRVAQLAARRRSTCSATMPFSMADTISNDPVDPMPAVVTTEWFDTLPDEAIDVVVAAGHAARRTSRRCCCSPRCATAGGAIRRNAAGKPNARGRSGELRARDRAAWRSARSTRRCRRGLHGDGARRAGAVRQRVRCTSTSSRARRSTSGAWTAYSPAALARMSAVKHAVDPDERAAQRAGPAGGRPRGQLSTSTPHATVSRPDREIARSGATRCVSRRLYSETISAVTIPNIPSGPRRG